MVKLFITSLIVSLVVASLLITSELDLAGRIFIGGTVGALSGGELYCIWNHY